jgi:hypothetical protein
LQIDNEIKTQYNNIVIKEINETTKNNALFINLIDKVIFQKWYIEVTFIINVEFQLTTITLLDSWADMNCIQEEIILTKYFEKTTKKLHQASGTRLNIGNKISNTHICNDVIYSQSILKKQLKNYTKLVEHD